MPSLNITFTEEEHAVLREAADRADQSLEAFVHASKRIARVSAELNRRLA